MTRYKVAHRLSSFLLLVLLASCRTAPAPPDDARSEPAQSSAIRLRVLSFNIHHGEGTDGRIDLPRIADVINRARPDLVALQEVDRGVARTSRADQPAELARLTNLTVIFERNITYQGGDYGNAVLSRFPVTRHRNHALPSMYAGEQRGVLEVEVTLPNGQPLLFFATHLDYRRPNRERLASATYINELVKGLPHQPALLAGDLNDLPQSVVLQRFSEAWTRSNVEVLPTFPTELPRKQIDYILHRPAERWRLIEARVLDHDPAASDHRPVLAVLELVPEQ